MSQCPMCHQFYSSKTMCKSCLAYIQTLRRNKNYCIHCGCEIAHGNICGICQTRPYVIENFWASYYYRPPLTKLIQQWKFHSKIQYSGFIGEIMLLNPPTWIHPKKVDYILAMPITKQSYQKRLFNQSDELAKIISKRYNIPIWKHYHITKHNENLQHNLPQKARVKNIKNAFYIHQWTKVSNILIIDDVATTLATINELANCLKSKHDYKIFAWVLTH